MGRCMESKKRDLQEYIINQFQSSKYRNIKYGLYALC